MQIPKNVVNSSIVNSRSLQGFLPSKKFLYLPEFMLRIVKISYVQNRLKKSLGV